MKHIYQNYRRVLPGHYLKISFLLLLAYTCNLSSMAQCPVNIDFERGNFFGWQCWTGTVSASGGNNNINLSLAPGPVNNRHTMLSTFPGDGLDPYGGFPINCPNGSGHSIKLGNNQGGHEAEGVSYTFTIPPAINKFSIIYHYAVVFQGPNHLDAEQPRFVTEVRNLTDGTMLGCSSDTFFYHNGGPNLPGFINSPLGTPTNPILYKNWSANTINLDGFGGKTIQLFFKTADCTFTAHFGYGYVDVNTECSSVFVGANYCPDDTAINVRGPYGYDTYSWWNSSFTQLLGTGQVLHLQPPPPPGTTIAVAVTPYNGYGCPDTLYAQLIDTLSIQADAGRDTFSCNKSPVPIGSPPKQTFIYQWTPAAGLSDPTIANPVAAPDTTTTYILKVNHDGGGCVDYDTVVVYADSIHNFIHLNGSAAFCAGDDHAILSVEAADSIQWFKDNLPIPVVNVNQYTVTQSGVYNAQLFHNTGCMLSTLSQQIIITPKPLPGFTINNPSQCLQGNQFTFNNNTTVSAGSLVYAWDFGDGSTDVNRDVVHSYTSAGDYTVKMVVATDGGPCKDSTIKTVHVNVNPDTSLTFTGVHAYCIGKGQAKLELKPGFTVQWFRNNTAIPGAAQAAYMVTQTGDYYATVATGAGCTLQTRTEHVDVYASPVAGFTENSLGLCFSGHQFVLTNASTLAFGSPLIYNWNMGDGSANQNTQDVNYSYAVPGDYKVKLLVNADGGCSDSISKNLHVFPSPKADFAVQPVCVNLQVPLANRTINNTTSSVIYLWDFGNGVTSTAKNPMYAYPLPGNYTVKLSVSTTQCPTTFDTKQVPLTIDAPAPGFRYVDVDAVTNFPEKLSSRNFGYSVLWTPPTSLDNRTSANPLFRSFDPQLYNIEIRTKTGCLTVDTQYVKVHKKIEIYVPTVFTPGADGKNDLLRPLLMGFKQVNFFRIYNRWGKLLFEMKSDRPGWDGSSKDLDQSTQAVVWMIEAIDMDGVLHKAQGSTVLVR